MFRALSIICLLLCFSTIAYAENENNEVLKENLAEIQTEILSEEFESNDENLNPDKASYTIFDDASLLNGYSAKYMEFSKEILLEMIKDDTLTPYKSAAAVRVFREKFGDEIVSREKKQVEKFLLRRLNRTTSPFVQVEVMYTLNSLDRYRYFKSMIPALIQKLDHYNEEVNVLSFKYLDVITNTSNYRAREARIVFNTLRKVMFLSRKRLAKIETPNPRLTRKLKLLRWSIKVLGNQELKRLPKEVLGLL